MCKVLMMTIGKLVIGLNDWPPPPRPHTVPAQPTLKSVKWRSLSLATWIAKLGGKGDLS